MSPRIALVTCTCISCVIPCCISDAGGERHSNLLATLLSITGVSSRTPPSLRDQPNLSYVKSLLNVRKPSNVRNPPSPSLRADFEKHRGFRLETPVITLSNWSRLCLSLLHVGYRVMISLVFRAENPLCFSKSALNEGGFGHLRVFGYLVRILPISDLADLLTRGGSTRGGFSARNTSDSYSFHTRTFPT